MNVVILTRLELYEKVWSKPMVNLAKEFNLSDNGLRKICKKHNIPTPLMGHWQKIQNGKKTSIIKLPKTKKEQQIKITINDKKSKSLETALEINLISEKIRSNKSLILKVPEKLNKPSNGAESIPENKNDFKGIDVDFEKLRCEQKQLGDAGEALVKQREIDLLVKKKLFAEAAAVKIVKDGKGYDILSFDENGNHKYIEVKTTTGNEYAPFYLSDNEVSFMESNFGSYSIYRVYNYNADNNFGEFFELDGDLKSDLLMKPIQYKVFIKKN